MIAASMPIIISLNVSTTEKMTELLAQNHLYGIVVGLVTFLIIGLFHPLVIKGEYYFGKKIRLAFVISGVFGIAGCIIVDDLFLSTVLGVTAFSCFWSVKEVNEQEERVRKGWFPRNPHRKYPWDI